jgi:hypothetical protein
MGAGCGEFLSVHGYPGVDFLVQSSDDWATVGRNSIGLP